MELAAIIISFALLVVSGVAAVAAIVQAKAASTSSTEAQDAVHEARVARDEARELSKIATAAFVRQAEAQERANKIREEELAPPHWTTRWAGGDLHSVANTSERPIKLHSVEALPKEAERKLYIELKDGGLYAYGDSFDYAVSKSMGARLEKMVLTYEFLDDKKHERMNFIILL